MELQSDTTNQIFLWINIQYVKYCFGWIFIMLNNCLFLSIFIRNYKATDIKNELYVQIKVLFIYAAFLNVI